MVSCYDCDKDLNTRNKNRLRCWSCYQIWKSNGNHPMLGRKNPHPESWYKSVCGRIPWNKGISHFAGSKNPGYKDGRWNPIQKRSRLSKSIIHKDLAKIVQRIYEDNIKKYGTLTCFYCLREIAFGKDTIDHMKPLSRGGNNSYFNMVVACHPCNSGKRNKTSDEYSKYLEKGAQ